MKLLEYSKTEFKALSHLKKEWCRATLDYKGISNLLVDLKVFVITYEVRFPESTRAINKNERFKVEMRELMLVFDKYLKDGEMSREELKINLQRIDLAFFNLLFDMRWKVNCGLKEEDIF